MKHEIFLEELSKLAEWCYLTDTEDRKNSSKNKTAPVIIKNILYPTEQCSDCGAWVKNRTMEQRLMQFPEPHWRMSCATCNRIQNPETGEFNLDPRQYNHFCVRFIKKQTK